MPPTSPQPNTPPASMSLILCPILSKYHLLCSKINQSLLELDSEEALSHLNYISKQSNQIEKIQT